MSLFGRSIEDWSVLAAAAVYVYIRHSDKPPLRRAAIVTVSGILAVNLAPEIGAMTSAIGPRTIMLLLLVGIWFALDLFSSLIAEREEIFKLILKHLGGRK